jgi:energy-coupling factor transporter ATP-binding protein EcfA2
MSSLTSILCALDGQVAPSKEPLLPGNDIVYGIVGKKGSGKSTLLLSLLASKRAFKHRFNRIWMFSPTARGDDKFKKLVEELDGMGQFWEEMNDTTLRACIDRVTALNKGWKSKRKRIRHLLLLDDCMCELGVSKQAAFSRIIIQSRHLHVSCVITAQKYNGIPPIIRAQFDLLSVFKSYNTREITTLQEDVSIDRATFYEIYNFCTDGDHSFMHVNFLTNPITFYKKFDELDVDLSTLNKTY